MIVYLFQLKGWKKENWDNMSSKAKPEDSKGRHLRGNLRDAHLCHTRPPVGIFFFFFDASADPDWEKKIGIGFRSSLDNGYWAFGCHLRTKDARVRPK